MWKKVLRVVFYILIVLSLLATIGCSIVTFVHAYQMNSVRLAITGGLIFLGGLVADLLLFALFGSYLDFLYDVAEIKDLLRGSGKERIEILKEVKKQTKRGKEGAHKVLEDSDMPLEVKGAPNVSLDLDR